MPNKRPRYTPEEVAEALRASGGIQSAAARRLGCTARTIRNYLTRHPELRETITEAREGLKDLAEAKLVQLIREGNTTAIIFFLKTQAKERGYSQSTRIEVSGALDVKTGFEDSPDETLDAAIDKLLRGEPEAPQGAQ